MEHFNVTGVKISVWILLQEYRQVPPQLGTPLSKSIMSPSR